jgi:DNA-binding LytR/AlgR family response regulator
MNCIIVDDDDLSCRVIEEFVQKTNTLKHAGTFKSAVEARNALLANRDIGLIFLDILMPEMDGFDLIDSLETPPNIIVISAADRFAAKAYDLNVVDYLVKPVSYGRFCKAIEKTISHYTHRENGKSNIPQGDREIFIKKGSTLVKLKFREIVYIEALENYITMATSEEKFTIHFTMKAIESQLPPELFIRVHRSYIVNKSMIQTIKEKSLDLLVGKTEKNIPLGKSFRDALLSDINVMAK